MPYVATQISVIIVVLRKDYAERMDQALQQLRAGSMKVTKVLSEEGVVEGIIETSKLRALGKLNCVQYIRKEATYLAERLEAEESTEPFFRPVDPRRVGKRYP